MHFQVINARIPQTTATPMQTARAMLLKSKKPLPVPVIAQAIAKMVMRTKTMLTIFKMVFFKPSHSFVKSRFVVPSFLLYHNSESVEIGSFLGGFPTFRIYGTDGQKSVDLR